MRRPREGVERATMEWRDVEANGGLVGADSVGVRRVGVECGGTCAELGRLGGDVALATVAAAERCGGSHCRELGGGCGVRRVGVTRADRLVTWV
jgi:hypothetical protein